MQQPSAVRVQAEDSIQYRKAFVKQRSLESGDGTQEHDETFKEKLLKSKKEKKERYEHLGELSSDEEFLVDGGVMTKTKSKRKLRSGLLFTKQHKDKDSNSGVGGSITALGCSSKHSNGERRSVSKKSKDNKKVKQVSKSRQKISLKGVSKPVFGVSLSELADLSGETVPAVVRQCIAFIERHDEGLASEGIYRLSASKLHLEDLKRAANQGDESLAFADCNSAAALLKLYLRELPESILSDAMLPKFEQVIADYHPSAVNSSNLNATEMQIKALLQQLPAPYYALCRTVFLHMLDLMKHVDKNKMTLANLGVTLQPTLRMSQPLLAFLLTHAAALFEGTGSLASFSWRTSSGNKKSPSERHSLELPTTISEIEAEITKYEAIHQSLHNHLSQGFRDPEKEQRIWDVLTHLTQLKRKMKIVKRTIARNNSNNIEPIKQTSGVRYNLSPGPCLEMFEEKQLLAVQMQLRELIAKEARAVETLTVALRVQKDSNGIICSSETEQKTVEKEENIVQQQKQEDNLTEEEWQQKAQKLEQRRDDLMQQIINERYVCAHLRAQIEMLSISQPPPKIEATRL